MEKVIVLDDWLHSDEIRDLDYDVVHELNEYDDDDCDMGLIVEHLN
jgi:hypothetical protein